MVFKRENMYWLEHTINMQRLWSKEMSSVLNIFMAIGPTHTLVDPIERCPWCRHLIAATVWQRLTIYNVNAEVDFHCLAITAALQHD